MIPMTMDEWVKKYIGKAIDYDGVYGVQCVDLIKHFVKHVLEIEPQSIGNAIDYYNKRKSSDYLTNNFKWISNTADFVPQKGDLCVFTSKSGLGHISVAAGEGTISYFYSYDENYPTGNHEPMTKIKHTYKSFLGVLRPKDQTNIKRSAALNAPDVQLGTYALTNVRGIYNGCGAKTGRKKVKNLTVCGRLHATSKKAGSDAYLKANTKVTLFEVKQHTSGNLWARIPSGWLCIWEKDKNKKFVK